MIKFNNSFLLVILISFCFLSCKEDNTLDGEVTVNLNSDPNINYTIQGIVYNMEGNVPMSNVSVSVADTSVVTDENGIYTIPNLIIGTYLLTFEQAGFQTIVKEIGSESFGYSNVESSNIVSSNAIFMYEKSETLSVNFSILNGQLKQPAANVPVKITIYSPTLGFFENTVQTIETDADGQLTVPDLPKVSVSLEIDTTIEGEPFTYTNSGSIKSFNNSGSLYLTGFINNDFAIVSGNIFDNNGNLVNDFDPTQDITITYSAPLDPDSEYLKVSLSNASNDLVLIDFTISDNTITISPTDASLSEGMYYDLDIQLQSIDGIYRFNSFIFSTAGTFVGEFDPVTNLTLDESTTIEETTSYVTIEFSQVVNAIYYEIYANYSEDSQNEFVRIDSFYPYDFDSDGFLEYNFSLSQDGITDPSGNGFFSPAGASYTIKVRAFSYSGGAGAFADLTFVLGDTGS